MQRVLQLLIQGKRVDLFKDETVKITQTIKNIQQVDKIFTEFTQTFTIPASKKNNKIFKHYYNFDIVNGFDAREKVRAELEINTLPFKKGKVQLNGVNIKNKKPESYRITFYGQTITLKDLLGEDKLSSLNLAQYDRPYGPGSVLGRLVANPNHGNASNEQSIITPLITHTQRLFYDSTDNTPQTGNLRPATALHGVKWNQLKYAIRVNELISRIEEKYSAPNYPVNLTFSNDFFKNKSITKMNNLFMWLHRKSGPVENLNGTDETITFVEFNNGPNMQPANTGFFRNGTTIFIPPEVGYTQNWQFITLQDVQLEVQVPSGETDPYRVQVYRFGLETPVFQSDVITGSYLEVFNDIEDGSDVWVQGNTYQIAIVATTAITINRVEVHFSGRGEIDTQGFDGEVPFTTNINRITQFTTQSIFTFITTQQIPELKIIDLLTGLFKMFNLVAYAENITDPYDTPTGAFEDQQRIKINVLPYDDYYANYNTYQIDEYVDTTKQTVNVALPYKKVLFKYKDSKSFLAERYRQLANKGWGELSYSEPSLQEIGGALYKVEIPFGHFQFERLNDGDTTTEKNIMWGWSVNESQNSYKGAPLLFYPIRTNTGGISVGNVVNADTDEIESRQSKTFVNLPSNTVSLDPTVDKTTLHFDLEINEYTRNTQFNDTLFQEEYFTYIVDVYNRRRRLIKIKAFLPLKIFLDLSLSDRLAYRGELYNINKITTNLITGESDIELLNVITNYD